jgi:hypothetical protein
VNLDNSSGAADGQADSVILSDTHIDDSIQILPFGGGTRVAVLGLTPRVNIVGSDGISDHLTVNALGAHETVDDSDLPANLIGLTVNVGDGQGASATTTTLRSSIQSGVFGQPVTLTATVASQAGAPTGTVTFLDGDEVLGSAAVSAAGQATSTDFLNVGNHALKAVYSGDAMFAASASVAVAENIDRAGTATSLIASTDPALIGQMVEFTVGVTPFASDSGRPSGTVTLVDGNLVLGAAELAADGRAIFDVRFAEAGGHLITVIYSGDADFAASFQTISEVVRNPPALAPTKTMLSASANVIHRGQTVKFSAKVSDTLGSTKPTGIVTFLVRGVVVAQVQLNRAGQASFKHRFPLKGRFGIEAIYSGDTNFAASARTITERIIGV